MGVLIPPLIIEYGDVSTYITAAIVVTVVGLIMATLTIPAMREDKELIKRQLRILEEQKEKVSFWKTLKYVMKDKNFVAYVITYFGLQPSLNYLNLIIIIRLIFY